MTAIRRLFAHRGCVALLCTAILAVKLLVPAGYMLDQRPEHFSVMVCSGINPGAMTIAIPQLGDSQPGHGQSSPQHKAEMPCAFAGLSSAAVASIDSIQLAALIAFVLAFGLLSAATCQAHATPRLRPPLRGPPIRL